MTYGLVTGMGRSGSKWTAHALSTATELDARHESRNKIGEFCRCPGSVEVNSYWRYGLKRFRQTFPLARIVHLVRDGRDVVRSAMSRKDWTFEAACDYWTEAVHLVEPVATFTVQLERLTSPDEHYERLKLCIAFGADYDPQAWAPLLFDVRNETRAHAFAHWTMWDDATTRTFWDRCGDAMREVGYMGGA